MVPCLKGRSKKLFDHLTPLYRRWINASRFVVLSTVGPEGTDASPRGDSDEVVRIADAKTLWLPDWRGNKPSPRLSLTTLRPNNLPALQTTKSLALEAQEGVQRQTRPQARMKSSVVSLV